MKNGRISEKKKRNSSSLSGHAPASGTEIVLVDTVFPRVHMKVTDNASNIKKAFKFVDDEATNRKPKYPTVGRRLV